MGRGDTQSVDIHDKESAIEYLAGLVDAECDGGEFEEAAVEFLSAAANTNHEDGASSDEALRDWATTLTKQLKAIAGLAAPEPVPRNDMGNCTSVAVQSSTAKPSHDSREHPEDVDPDSSTMSGSCDSRVPVTMEDDLSTARESCQAAMTSTRKSRLSWKQRRQLKLDAKKQENRSLATDGEYNNEMSDSGIHLLKGLEAQGLTDMSDLDDYAAAWLDVKATGGKWGGRGKGGRGLYLMNQGTGKEVNLFNVTLAYHGHELLRGARVRFVPGKRYALIGRNGSGKSSLLKRMAAGMVPGFPLHLRVKYVSQEVPLILRHGHGAETSMPSERREYKIRQRVDGSVEVDGSMACVEVVVAQLNQERHALQEELQELEQLILEAENGSGEADDIDVGAVTDRMEEISERILELDSAAQGPNASRSSLTAGERFEIIDRDLRARAWEILRGLQFDKAMAHAAVSTLSGGWRTRLVLALALCDIKNTDLLLLDEPTNHLDLHAVLWLRSFLVNEIGSDGSSYNEDGGTSGCTLVIVSHDHDFMDAVAQEVVVLDHHEKLLKYYPGNYSTYDQTMQEAADRMQSQQDAVQRQRKKAQDFVDKQRKVANTKRMDENKQAQAKQKLNKMERLTMFHQHGFKFKTHSLKSMVDVTRKGDVASLPRHVQAELRSDPFLRFKLPVPDNIGIAEGMPLLTMSEVCYSYSSTTRSAPGPSAKPSSLARALEEKRRSTKAATKMKGAKRSMPDVAANPPHILNNVTLQLTSLSRVAVVGKNGCGKSTLLKLLTGGLEPVAGQLWKHHNVKMALVEQHNVEALMEHLDCTPVQLLLDMFSALDGSVTAARAHLGAFAISGQLALQKIGTLSGGQKARLAFAIALFHKPHILLLDEPTNHLDMESIHALVAGLSDYKGAVVLVSHNTYFVKAVCKELWLVDKGIVQVSGGTVEGADDFAAHFNLYCDSLGL